jgi:hypothetical protein
MITKEDHAIFSDWCQSQLVLYDAVVCLDGSTTDATERAAKAYPKRLIYLHERDFEIAHKTDHGLRRVVHEEIVRRFGVDNWIMCCHADEFCYHDPRKAAVKAARDGHDLVVWFSPFFLPHPSEWGDWRERRHLPVPDRVRHYHWDYQGNGLPWLEGRLYRNGPQVEWDEKTHASMRPHGIEGQASFHPILRHYKVFSVDPAWYEGNGGGTLFRNHWAGTSFRTGLPFAVRRPEDLFVGSYPDFGRCDRFDGAFPEAWNMGEEYRPEEKAVIRPLRAG